MQYLQFRDFIVYGILFIFVIYVLKKNNMLGVRKGTVKTRIDVKTDKRNLRKKLRLLRCLKFFEKVGNTFGFMPSAQTLRNFEYRIKRSRQQFVLLERPIQPIELLGIFKFVSFIGVFIGVVGSLFSGNFLFLLFCLAVFSKSGYIMIVDSMIASEDREIEKDFPDLFFFLYSRLVKGAKVRLAPTLDEYIKSLDAIYGEDSHKAMHAFIRDIRNNIELYGDDSMAVNMLRDTYKSAMLVNFFNLAIQSLKGVDNRDKLLGFKMELSQQSLKAMEEIATKRANKAMKIIWLIFIIVGEFVVLSWLAKLGVGTLSNLLKTKL